MSNQPNTPPPCPPRVPDTETQRGQWGEATSPQPAMYQPQQGQPQPDQRPWQVQDIQQHWQQGQPGTPGQCGGHRPGNGYAPQQPPYGGDWRQPGCYGPQQQNSCGFSPQQPPYGYGPQQPPYGYDRQRAPQPWQPYSGMQPRSNSMGTVGFIFALLSIFCGWIPIAGWIVWLVGAVFSFIGLFSRPRGLAIAGVIISLVLIPLIVTVLVTLNSVSDILFYDAF